MSHFHDLLHSTLLTDSSGKSVPTGEALANTEVVALYFSAHWCGPCRGFTPQLAAKYAELKASEKRFEVVFVSSDRDEASFTEYYATMPWLALPFADRDTKEALSRKFKVSGIPTLVLLDGVTGELITTNGRSKVMDPAAFPWAPKTLKEMLGDTFVRAGGEAAPALPTQGVLGLYFSAHWCPPCRGFTPVLAEKYKALKAAGKDLEVVFLSGDQGQAAFDEYLGEMPWIALPFAKRKEKEELSEHFGVRGIPTLVFVDAATGKTINDEGRAAISADSYLEDYPFHPKPVNDLAAGPGKINEAASVIVLMEHADEVTQAAVEEALHEVAAPELLKPEAKQRAGAFFTAKEGGGIAGKIRSMVGLPALPVAHPHALDEKPSADGRWGCDGCQESGDGKAKRFRCAEGCDFDLCGECQAKAGAGVDAAAAAPRLVLLDIPDRGGFYVAEAGAVTAASVEKFLAAYKAGELERKQLQG